MRFERIIAGVEQEREREVPGVNCNDNPKRLDNSASRGKV
jgi:hypothetical protein